MTELSDGLMIYECTFESVEVVLFIDERLSTSAVPILSDISWKRMEW
jgi:hypothetical protein